MKKQIISIIVAFMIGLSATMGIYLIFTKQHFEVISPLSLTQFSLQNAPTQALIGHITSISGSVFWQSRTDSLPSIIAAPQNVQQGEEVGTGDDGKMTLIFDKIANITESKNTDIAIIQTLPASIVFDEKSGSAEYEKLDSGTPLSVRGLDLLIEINSGKVSVMVDKITSIVTVNVMSGVVNIAFTDTTNTSVAVGRIAKGATIVFNNNTKTYSAFP